MDMVNNRLIVFSVVMFFRTSAKNI